MKEILIKNEEIIKIAKESIPAILKETFSRSYSNPLKEALDDIFKSEEFKEELKKIILECYKEVKKEIDFKVFVKEAIVSEVIKSLVK